MQKEKNKLHFVQYCDDFYPQIDGVIKVVNNYSKYLNQMGMCKVVVPRYKKNPYDDSVFSYEVLRRPTQSIYINKFEIPLPRSSRSITKSIKDFDADIYHVHSPFFIGHYALKLSRRYKIPLVATFHSQFKEDIMSITHSKLITKLILGYIVRFFNRCDEVWTPSKKSADTLQSYGFKKDIIVMENGTDFSFPNNLDVVRKEALETFKIDVSKKNLLYVGQLRYVKNIKLILNTVKELIQEDPSYHLYLAGEGCDEKSMREFVTKNNMDSNVHFVGKIANIRLLQGLYSVCDLFFFPSTYDNSSIVVREASVMRLPSLMTIGSNVAEPFIDGENGFLAEENVDAMKAKILDAFADKQKLKAVGIRASETIPISFKTMSERTLERYKVVIKNYQEKHSKK